MKKVMGMLLAGLALSACQTTTEAENVAALGVDFTWKNTKACSTTPPAFNISNVPEGTKFLRFHMADLNVPGYVHGGGTIAYVGKSQVDQGSFGYTGPCPPSGSHNYRFKVEALNEAKNIILGKGENTKSFPSS